MGGNCFCFPKKLCNTFCKVSSVNSGTGISLTTVPLSSPVSVCLPKVTSTKYCLRPSTANSKRRVAVPVKTGRTPAASGSRVPPCPTFLVLSARRRKAITSWEVIPGGFNTLKIPSLIMLYPLQLKAALLLLPQVRKLYSLPL